MRAAGLRRITIVLAALMVSACAGLRPASDPMTFADAPSATAPPNLHEDVPFSVNFDAALRQAQDLRKRGDFDSASRVLAQLVIAAPNDARVIGEYGKVMLESGRTDDAVAFLERAVTLNHTDWTLFSALGIAYDQSGRGEAARAAFKHALALKPGEPAVLSNLAVSHIQAGELDDAERLLLQASGQERDVPGLADKLAMVRSLKDTARQSSALAPGPLTDQAPEIQTSQPDAASPAPAPAIVEPSRNAEEDEEPATPEAPEPETVALAVEPPAVIPMQPGPIKTVAPQVQQKSAAASPNAVRPPPKIAAISRPPARPVAPRPPASGARAEPGEPPRPAGVARAVTRTATIPLVATPPAEPWELLMRVSLPPPSAGLEKPRAAVVVAPPAANEKAERPSGWGDMLERWSSAVLAFIGELWLRAFPAMDVEVA
jgi:Flp pilus assembly protein TadD